MKIAPIRNEKDIKKRSRDLMRFSMVKKELKKETN